MQISGLHISESNVPQDVQEFSAEHFVCRFGGLRSSVGKGVLKASTSDVFTEFAFERPFDRRVHDFAISRRLEEEPSRQKELKKAL